MSGWWRLESWHKHQVWSARARNLWARSFEICFVLDQARFPRELQLREVSCLTAVCFAGVTYWNVEQKEWIKHWTCDKCAYNQIDYLSVFPPNMPFQSLSRIRHGKTNDLFFPLVAELRGKQQCLMGQKKQAVFRTKPSIVSSQLLSNTVHIYIYNMI